jgi:small-conductance mechanosensitive channel
MASRYILRFINILFNEIEMGTLNIDGFHREWAVPTYKLVRILVLAFTLVVLFPYLPGSGSPAFQGVSVFLGILLSFGSSSSIGNIVAGIVLTYMRPFKVGDRVKISDTVGDVVEKTLLVTRLRTIKNVDVTIPNSMILASHIINYSSSALSSGLILNTTVTIGYDSPWNIVHDLLKKAALITTDILQDPSPYILQTSLDDFYVSYELNAFTRHPNRMANIYSELHRNIQDTFNDAGVEIMSPHYTSLRDGNEVTIPSDKRADGYISPKFKIDSNTEK